MNEYLIHNGKLIDAIDFELDRKNRAFRFGDGLFETMRVTRRKINFLDDHLERLLLGLDTLEISKHKDFEAQKMETFADHLCCYYKTDNLRLRMSVFRSAGGLYTPVCNNAEYLIEAWPMEESNFRLNKTGISILLYSKHLKPINAFGAFKNLQTSIYSLAGLEAKRKGKDDSVIQNQEGYVCEATSSNLFLLINSELITPELKSGCVFGIMRKQILNCAKQIGIPCYERKVTVDELKKASELFITNAARGITWISEYNNHQYTSVVSKEICNELNRRLSL